MKSVAAIVLVLFISAYAADTENEEKVSTTVAPDAANVTVAEVANTSIPIANVSSNADQSPNKTEHALELESTTAGSTLAPGGNDSSSTAASAANTTKAENVTASGASNVTEASIVKASESPVTTAAPKAVPTGTPDSNSPFVAKGVYVKTTAAEKQCKQNPDCYGLREPDEWCPLPEQHRYGDKGCFCDHVRNVCTIQRSTERGDEFSDCAEKSTSACAGLKPFVHIQQQSAKQPRHKNKQRLRVH